MKKAFLLFLLVAAAVTANAQQKQSLKDLLYGGKLKMDSNSVIRKGDDLSSKIDTAAKKPTEPEKQKTTTVAINPQKNAALKTDTVVAVVGPTDAVSTGETAITTTATPVKSNSKIWKEYTPSLIAGLTAEVLPSKKIKKEEYYVTVEYEIGTEGQFTITGVTSSPENEFLQGQVRDRIEQSPPQLSPVFDSSGKARKQKKKQSFLITKE